MDFRDAARLDTSRVSDVRGRGGFGGGRGAAIGGGGLGIVGLLLALLLGVNPADLGGTGEGSLDPYGSSDVASTQELAQQCQTGADADRDPTCRIVALDNSLTDYWAGVVQDFRPATTQIFGSATTTDGCGSASSAVGPFYCPADEGIYLDPGFFQQLETRFGARGGDFAVAYVLAHEYGHHVQNLTGASREADRLAAQGEQSGSVRLELQADCYAGVWAANASRDGFVTFDDTDVAEGLSAAAAIGDDRIQETSGGRVDPESWTHGSAEQRQRWFGTGLRGGDPNDCDTFGVPEV